MFDLKGFEIYITRGDTASIKLNCFGRIPTDGDRVVASLKKTQTQTSEIWRKTLERVSGEDAYLLDFRSEDTENLDPGTYWWDVRAFYADGDVTTPIPPSKFEVMRVVTNLSEAGGG